MNILQGRHHVGSWVVLLVLALESVYTIPLRQKFFSHLPNQGHAHWIVWLYVSAMPVLVACVYVYFCSWAWRYRQGTRWHCPVPDPTGVGVQIAVCLGVLILDNRCFTYLYPGVRPPGTHLSNLVFTLCVLLVTGFLAVAIDGLNESRAAHAQQAQDAKNALAEMQGRLITAQIDPHAMLNAMGGVVELIDDDPEQAKVMIIAASGYLARLVQVTRHPIATLGQERALIADYLEVERHRMGDRLAVEWDWPSDLDRLRLPPILVQPLVENAIKHGIWPCRAGGTLRLRARVEGSTLAVTVANTGAALASDRREGAIGLANVRARLGHAYGPGAALSLRTLDGWTVATLTIPTEPPCAS